MTRRLVIAAALLGMLGGAGAAFADTTSPRSLTHEVCVATSNDPHHQTTDDFCVTWPGADQ
jgi:hypothetical protein